MENTFKYTDTELSLIKSIFAENDKLLITLRKFLVGVELNAVELAEFAALQNKETIKLLRKIFVPIYDPEAQIGQTSDIWKTLNLPTQVKEQMIPHIIAVQITFDWLDQRFNALENEKVKKAIEFTELLDGTFESISARHRIMDIIENSLLFLKVIAGDKKETPGEQKKRLMQNSNK